METGAGGMEREAPTVSSYGLDEHELKIGDQVFRFRSLTRKELREAEEKHRGSQVAIEDEICRIALTSPKDFDFDSCLAGIPTTLCQAIIQQSNFLTRPEIRELLESNMDSMMEQGNRLDMLMMTAMPGTSLDEIEGLVPEEYIRRLAMSIFMLTNFMGADPEKISRMLMSRQELEAELEKDKRQGDRGGQPDSGAPGTYTFKR
jgi:hypothetical protein